MQTSQECVGIPYVFHLARSMIFHVFEQKVTKNPKHYPLIFFYTLESISSKQFQLVFNISGDLLSILKEVSTITYMSDKVITGQQLFGVTRTKTYFCEP